MLVRDLALEIYEKDHLLVTGPSGSGKTSLLRAIAGLWSTGRGTITFYTKDDTPLSPDVPTCEVTSTNGIYGDLGRPRNRNSRGVFFLPQRPYMVLGTLRQQLLYPTWNEDSDSTTPTSKTADSLSFLKRVTRPEYVSVKPPKPTTDDLIQVLEVVRLGYVLSRFNSLDSTYEWSSVLSLGEQQCLAFARLLISKPYLVLLDESTSALDEANEANLYRLIEAAGITYISVGHRSSLFKHHNRILNISTVDPDSTTPNWYIDSTKQDPLYNLSKQ